MTDLPKTFDPAAIEAKWYAHWEGNGLFRPERPDAQPFTIVNPPPNVTGSLHIGHALDNTLQDVVVRYERLRGKDALWVVGTDHAGIATQMVVERQLEQKQDKRTNYTRDQFVEKVWAWKAESGGQITRQLRRLGCSMDWSREQFTMDPHFTRAVVKVFVELYNQGLLYRDKRLVNWDPKLKTAISDLEVETREVQGGFWHFRYPLADGVRTADGADHIVVATTRPETMLADMAVAVHPEDPRYRDVIGKDILQPITGRRFKVVGDEHADPELGSGAVKITPGHDFNDFEVGKRAGIRPADMLNMLDAEARVVQTADGLIPSEFLGLDRFDARRRVVERMKELGCLVPFVDKNGEAQDAEPRVIQTPFGDRGGVVIEPWLTDQWYVDAATLAKPAIEAVRDGRIEIVPKTWEKTYFNWMENIQPWCVSRQLWWGHRIPAWYGPKVIETASGKRPVYRFSDDRDLQIELKNATSETDAVFVAETEEEAVAYFESKLSGYEVIVCDTVLDAEAKLLSPGFDGDRQVVVWRDEDVLDTWFSSALWPFATLGWPDDNSSPSSLGEGDHAAGMVEGDGGDSPPPPRPSGAVPLPETSSGRNLLARHYPNDLLISGFDILFFWDARMAMQGMHFMKDVPWRRLYLHGLVRAADGQKMSKSKGNVVDPLGLIDKFGADALRFFMAAMESQGRDVKMDEKRVEGYRNFATKLWNATRFAMANGIGASASVEAPAATLPVNKWIIGEVVETVAALDRAMAELRFDAAANAIYHFVWDRFCDWYLELIKPVLSKVEGPNPPQYGEGDHAQHGGGGSPPATRPKALPLHHQPAAGGPPPRAGEELDVAETRAVAGWVLDQILVMLHPFMPFITEELWHALGERDGELIVAQWPEPEAPTESTGKFRTDLAILLIAEIRRVRTEIGLSPSQKTGLAITWASDHGEQGIEIFRSAIERLGRVKLVDSKGYGRSIDSGFASVDTKHIQGKLILEGVIDIAAEKARLAKALEAAAKEVKSLEGRLNNPAFVEKAKPEAVEKARADHAERKAEAERLEAALKRLG